MPKSRFQGFFFGVIMSYAMALGMEVYNIAVREGVNLTAGGFGNMTDSVFAEAFKEVSYMGLLGHPVFQSVGKQDRSPIGAKHFNPETDNPYICRLFRQVWQRWLSCVPP